MKRNTRHTQSAFALRQFLCALVVLCISLSGISPACQFISGGTLTMELCRADGSYETVTVDENGNQVDENAPAQNDREAKSPCAFCFTSAHLQPINTGAPTVPVPVLTGQTGLLTASFILARQSAGHLYAPRAPPAFS